MKLPESYEKRLKEINDKKEICKECHWMPDEMLYCGYCDMFYYHGHAEWCSHYEEPKGMNDHRNCRK